MPTLGLVQAGSDATREPAPAAEAYDTEFFRLKREFARTCYDDWLVISSAHGLLGPDETVERGGPAFADMEPADRARWAMDVVTELAATVRRNEYGEVAVLADRPVRETLTERGGLRTRVGAAGATMTEPLAGLGGEERQRTWLAEQLSIRRSRRG